LHKAPLATNKSARPTLRRPWIPQRCASWDGFCCAAYRCIACLVYPLMTPGIDDDTFDIW